MSRANVTLRNNYHIQCLWLHDPEHSWEGTSPDLIDLVLLTTVHSFRVRGRSQTELWVTEVSISVDIMQTFPNHLLLSEKALICYQQVQLGLRNTERAFIKTCSNLTARVSSIKLSTLPDRAAVVSCSEVCTWGSWKSFICGWSVSCGYRTAPLSPDKRQKLYSLPDKTVEGYIESQHSKPYKFSLDHIHQSLALK